MAKAIEAALDELYAANPGEFVATRKRLAKKHPALAKRRKPTQTAYALNQLARRHPDAVADLVDAGRALARAQRKALRGSASGLREAIDRQRTVIRERMQEVARLVTELGVDETHLPEIARALQAALVDPGVGEQLEEGHLERVPEAEGGLFSLTPADEDDETAPRKRAAAKKEGARAHGRSKATSAAAAKADARKKDADARAAKKAAAEEEARAKKKQADERRAAIAEAEARADALAKTARAAEEEARQARARASAARKDASAAASALARLRRAR